MELQKRENAFYTRLGENYWIFDQKNKTMMKLPWYSTIWLQYKYKSPIFNFYILWCSLTYKEIDYPYET